MSIQDPISDMLTRIRNSQMARKIIVEMPSSRIKISIAKILEKEGFIKKFLVKNIEKKTELEITLKYFQGQSVIENIIRVSRPGLRIYKKKNGLPKFMSGLGIAVISTSQGVMTDRSARIANLGGEVLCYIS